MYAFHFSRKGEINELKPGTHYGTLKAAIDRKQGVFAETGFIYVVKLPGEYFFQYEFTDEGRHDGFEEYDIANQMCWHALDIKSLNQLRLALFDLGVVGYRYVNKTEDVGSMSYCYFGKARPYLVFEVDPQAEAAILSRLSEELRLWEELDVLEKFAETVSYDEYQDVY